MWISRVVAMVAILLPINIWGQSSQPGPATQRYLYVVTPGIRDYLEFGGAGILVFDINNNHQFVKRIETPASKLDKPRNIKGVCASAITNRLYFSTPEKLYCVDLATEQTLWEVAPKNGCDRMSITPAGQIIYVPSFEKTTWNVIDANTGKVIQEIETNNGAHNTVVSLDGNRMYLGGLKSPMLFVADTTNHKIVKEVGPFGGAIRPFTVDGFREKAYVCVNDLLGFEVADLKSGKLLHRVAVSGFMPGQVKRHGCPSHGVGLTPDEREVWVVDAANQQLHIFDNTLSPPQQIKSIGLREQPGWITFSVDGSFAYPSTGEVINTRTKQIVSRLADEMGREVHSEKMIEIHMHGGESRQVGDQFGVGRTAVRYHANPSQQIESAQAVNLPHLFTPQCYSHSPDNSDSGTKIEPAELIQQALHKLHQGLRGSSLHELDHAGRPLLRLNFVATTTEIAQQIPNVLKNYFGGQPTPTITIAVGSLPDEAQVGVDAVALYAHPVGEVSTHRFDTRSGSLKICPAGPRVYISGQAEAGASPAEATAKTIDSLKRTLEWLGGDLKDAVQAKCFLNPMSAAGQVRAEFDKVFGEDQLPLVFVEWKSDLPIEIELIASIPKQSAQDDSPAIEFLTPPFMKSSPIYSRIVRVNRGNWIYTSGLTHGSIDANEQVHNIFGDLTRIMRMADSDLNHLVKATYYVSADSTSQSLNALRPQYYDPQRPPAASKAMIPALLGNDVQLQIDMIGVSNP